MTIVRLKPPGMPKVLSHDFPRWLARRCRWALSRPSGRCRCRGTYHRAGLDHDRLDSLGLRSALAWPRVQHHGASPAPGLEWTVRDRPPSALSFCEEIAFIGIALTHFSIEAVLVVVVQWLFQLRRMTNEEGAARRISRIRRLRQARRRSFRVCSRNSV